MTPTIGQVVISSYGWANGDIPPNELIAPDEVRSSSEYVDGDTLLQFLLQELVENDPEHENGPDHWAMASIRVSTVLRELQSVHDAIMRFDPELEIADD